MQYVLTSEEYDALRKQAQRGLDAPSVEDLQAFCTRVSDELPVSVPWSEEREPWGCIITVEKEADREHYCDECPSQKLCPYPHKEWSQ